MLRSLAVAFLGGAAVFLGTIGLSSPSFGQQAPMPAGEPPAVVGRIAHVTGTVSHKAAAANEWEKAERNWPIVVGDAIYAAADGQAKLEIGGASVTVRSNAVVDLAALDDRSASLRTNSGTAMIATSVGSEPMTIVTPRGNASLGPDGAYWVSAGDDGAQTEIAVCRGGVVLADGQTRLREGEMAILGGDPAAPQSRVVPHSGTCDATPLREARLPPKVSRRMTGIRDLGERGRWSRTPTGADIWFPDDVGEDWAPYRQGRWSWVAPWGWTWVDDASWGFAPFHYGRWTELEGRWGWLPGEYAEHPVYAPAMVAFVEPPADAVAGSGPTFGWVPLGPDEIYRPYYATSGNEYARRINMNVAGVGAATIGALIAAPLAIAALRNRRAATVVPVAIVNGGRPVGPAILQTRPQVLASTAVRPGGAPVMPRPSGAPRMPGAPGRTVAAPPRPLPPLAARPNLPVRPGGGQPMTPPVLAPGQPGARPGGSVAGRPPVSASRGPAAARRGAPSSGPMPRPTGPSTSPVSRGPGASPPSRAVPGSRQPATRAPGPVTRPAPPVARPPVPSAAAPVARPMPRPALPAGPRSPVAAPRAAPPPVARPAPPRAPVPRPAPAPGKPYRP